MDIGLDKIIAELNVNGKSIPLEGSDSINISIRMIDKVDCSKMGLDNAFCGKYAIYITNLYNLDVKESEDYQGFLNRYNELYNKIKEDLEKRFGIKEWKKREYTLGYAGKKVLVDEGKSKCVNEECKYIRIYREVPLDEDIFRSMARIGKLNYQLWISEIIPLEDLKESCGEFSLSINRKNEGYEILVSRYSGRGRNLNIYLQDIEKIGLLSFNGNINKENNGFRIELEEGYVKLQYNDKNSKYVFVLGPIRLELSKKI